MKNVTFKVFPNPPGPFFSPFQQAMPREKNRLGDTETICPPGSKEVEATPCPPQAPCPMPMAPMPFFAPGPPQEGPPIGPPDMGAPFSPFAPPTGGMPPMNPFGEPYGTQPYGWNYPAPTPFGPPQPPMNPMFPMQTIIAHSYVPWQQYNAVYSPSEALSKGTLFPELYQPQGQYGPCEGPQPCRIPASGGVPYGC